MSELHRAVQLELEVHRPEQVPNFAAVRARKRSRDRRRLAIGTVALASVSVLAVVTVNYNGIGAPSRMNERTDQVATTDGRAPCVSNAMVEDRIVRFGSLREMAAASEAVVVARATQDVEVEQLGADAPLVPVTTTRLKVLQTLHGELKQQTLKLRQLGAADQCVDGDVVQAGRTYVVAVTPFVLDPNPSAAATEEYVVSGTPAGLFELDAAKQEVRRLDEGSPTLPAKITLAEFRRQMSQ